jgi:hypothetical protein
MGTAKRREMKPSVSIPKNEHGNARAYTERPTFNTKEARTKSAYTKLPGYTEFAHAKINPKV